MRSWHGSATIITESSHPRLERPSDGFRVMPSAKRQTRRCDRHPDRRQALGARSTFCAEGRRPPLQCRPLRQSRSISRRCAPRATRAEGRPAKTSTATCCATAVPSTSSAEGRLVNLRPRRASRLVMDMSFATQALSAEWAVRASPHGSWRFRCTTCQGVEDSVAAHKLDSLGHPHRPLTPEQREYLSRGVKAPDLRSLSHPFPPLHAGESAVALCDAGSFTTLEPAPRGTGRRHGAARWRTGVAGPPRRPTRAAHRRRRSRHPRPARERRARPRPSPPHSSSR